MDTSYPVVPKMALVKLNELQNNPLLKKCEPEGGANRNAGNVYVCERVIKILM